MTTPGTDERFLQIATSTGVNADLLDVARAELIAHGVGRTSVADIARRAGVSRPTLYRRLGDKDSIVRAVVTRDVVRFFAEIYDRVRPLESAEERVVEAFALGVTEANRHPLVTAILEFDHETRAPLWTMFGNPPTPVVRESIASLLTDETLPMEQAIVVAELLLRITGILLVAPSKLLPIDTEDRAREFARVYFTAIIQATRQAPAASDHRAAVAEFRSEPTKSGHFNVDSGHDSPHLSGDDVD
jgi:AcrR family transcriptional regulator